MGLSMGLRTLGRCLCKLVVRDDDDHTTSFSKKVYLVAYFSAIVTTVIGFLPRHEPVGYVMSATNVVGGVGCFIQLLIERKLRHNVAELWLYLTGLNIMYGDLVKVAAYRNRTWAFFVLLVDISLVTRLKPRVTRNLVVALLLWLLVLFFESWMRFGLYDLSFLPSQAERREATDCKTIPCKQSIVNALNGVLAQCSIFLLDVYFTRSFAEGMYREHEKMEAAISATERIALSLAKFNLDEAEIILDTALLSPPLDAAFRSILSNLEMYRPYLPQSCFVHEDYNQLAGTADTGTPRIRAEDKESIDVFDSIVSSVHPADLRPPILDPPLITTDGGSRLRAIRVSDIAKSLEKRQCSFSLTNILESHRQVVDCVSVYQQKYKAFLETVITSYSSMGGVVGVVVGDHVHASFNAVKRCTGHAKHAVEGAVQLRKALQGSRIEVCIGVSTGMAYCGPLGCAELMSVGMIGPCAVAASVLQEFGRAEGYHVVCSGAVYSDVSYAYNMRIVLGVVEVCGRREMVYEVLIETVAKTPDELAVAEWMYRIPKCPWEAYNEMALAYLQGYVEAALGALDRPRGNEARAPTVMQYETMLRERIIEGAPVKVFGLQTTLRDVRESHSLPRDESHDHWRSPCEQR